MIRAEVNENQRTTGGDQQAERRINQVVVVCCPYLGTFVTRKGSHADFGQMAITQVRHLVLLRLKVDMETHPLVHRHHRTDTGMHLHLLKRVTIGYNKLERFKRYVSSSYLFVLLFSRTDYCLVTRQSW